MYLQEVTDVEVKIATYRNRQVPLLDMQGYRNDRTEMFVCFLFQPELGVWKRSICGYLEKGEETLDAVWEILEEQAMKTTEKQHAEWDQLASELLEHPKVRLHTLF